MAPCSAGAAWPSAPAAPTSTRVVAAAACWDMLAWLTSAWVTSAAE